jgi:hypothetical protein
MAVRCQLSIFPWRARKGVRRCRGGRGQLDASSYIPWRARRVFANARGGLFMTVYKASNRSIAVYRSRGQLGASSVYSPSGLVRVFTDARGGGLFTIIWQLVASSVFPLVGL